MAEISEPQKDHDLLIEINTILKQVVRDIQDLKDGTSVKIADHEKRIESIERWKSSVEKEIAKVPDQEKCIDKLDKELSNHSLGNKITLGIYATLGGALSWLLINHLIGK